MGLRVAIARSVRVVRRPAAWAKAAQEALADDRPDRGPPGRGIPWTQVRSSWIDALRWVPTDRDSPTAYLARGYIDMRTRDGRAYRYGPGISQRQFNTWRVAASRGRYWWRYLTRRWSPAQRI